MSVELVIYKDNNRFVFIIGTEFVYCAIRI